MEKNPLNNSISIAKIFLLAIFNILYMLIPSMGQGADTLGGLIRDFEPLTAKVLKVKEDALFLDAGAGLGVKTGDIFLVISKGAPIYSDRNKVLGYKQRSVAKCKVTSVGQSGSTCMIYQRMADAKGELKAIRFFNLKAAFFIDGRLVSPVFSSYSLERMLPNLKWLIPESGPMPVLSKRSMKAFGLDLIFELKGDEIKVFGPDLEPIGSYVVSNAALGASKEQFHDSKNRRMEVSPIFLGVDFANMKLLGKLEGKALQVAVGDLGADGTLDVVYLMGNQICVAPFKRQGGRECYSFPEFECPCDFSIKGRWLVVNVAIENAGLSSKLFEFRRGQLRLVQDEINLWLSFGKTMCGRGGTKLFGQEFERQRFRGQRIFLLRPTSDGIEYQERLDFPNDFSIQSTWATDLNGTCTLFYVSFDGFFKAYARGGHVWTSLYPVVGQRKRCGTELTNFIPIKNGILFQGLGPDNNSPDNNSLFYMPFGSAYYSLLRVETPFHGSICGMSLLSKSIIMSVVEKGEKAWETRLYEVPIQ